VKLLSDISVFLITVQRHRQTDGRRSTDDRQ